VGRNDQPLGPDQNPGAASGGEAVALATGMSPFGLGNDTLGSLPWPAQCCGVTALKPTSAGSPTVCARPRRTVDRT
jgi:amidase